MKFDLVTVGETMASLVRDPADGRYTLSHAGGESNVAITLAHLGHRTGWISRLGQDEFGDFILSRLREAGVETFVELDEERQTGLMIKHIHNLQTHVTYYRQQSAASAMTHTHKDIIKNARLMHITGVTPALSAQTRTITEGLIQLAQQGGTKISFDINLRPRLWANLDEARQVLLKFCEYADIIFIGEEEASTLIQSTNPDVFMEAIQFNGQQQILYKRGAHGVDYFDKQAHHFVPAHKVDVVELVGAGDAFAAGYLSGLLQGAEVVNRIQLGHFLASRVIQVVQDVASPPQAEDVQRILGFGGHNADDK